MKTILSKSRTVGLIIIREVEPIMYEYGTTKFKYRRVLCRCSCGKKFTTGLTHVNTGKTQSCGCLRCRIKGGGYKKRLPFAIKRRGDPITVYLKEIFTATSENAKRRQLDFKLVVEEFKSIVTLPCHYCGAMPRLHNRQGSYQGPFAWNGIDRKDNDIGYVSGNCVPCCSACNSAKSKLSKDEFLDLVRKIFRYSCQN
jgi:hypothetical protein